MNESFEFFGARATLLDAPETVDLSLDTGRGRIYVRAPLKLNFAPVAADAISLRIDTEFLHNVLRDFKAKNAR